HTLGLTVRDGTGATATASRTVTVTAPLKASFSSPAAGATVSGSTKIDMAASGAFNTPITFKLSIDGKEVSSMVGGDAFASFFWDTTPVAAGSHTLSLLVRDGVGRTATASISVIVTRCAQGQFLAEYFSNITLTPPATRSACEAAVNYDWGAGGPAGLPVDNFSVRWVGRFQFAEIGSASCRGGVYGIRVFLAAVE